MASCRLRFPCREVRVKYTSVDRVQELPYCMQYGIGKRAKAESWWDDEFALTMPQAAQLGYAGFPPDPNIITARIELGLPIVPPAPLTSQQLLAIEDPGYAQAFVGCRGSAEVDYTHM